MSNRLDTLAGHLLVLIAVVAVTLVGYYKNDAKLLTTHNALCSFKLDLQVRYETGAQFIADIKAGKRPPIADITIEELERSSENQRRTLDSLSALDC